VEAYDAAVIGAGAEGLTAAAILARAGLRTIVCERNTELGGRCQSIEFVVPASSYQGVLDPLLVPRSRGEKRQSGTAHGQGCEP